MLHLIVDRVTTKNMLKHLTLVKHSGVLQLDLELYSRVVCYV